MQFQIEIFNQRVKGIFDRVPTFIFEIFDKRE